MQHHHPVSNKSVIKNYLCESLLFILYVDAQAIKENFNETATFEKFSLQSSNPLQSTSREPALQSEIIEITAEEYYEKLNMMEERAASFVRELEEMRVHKAYVDSASSFLNFVKHQKKCE